MEDLDFGRSLEKLKDSLAELAERSEQLSEEICSLLAEHDGDAGEMEWACRTMNNDILDVVRDLDRRVRRYREGDLDELPSVLVLAIECCERLRDTAELCMQGRGCERRDLKGQIGSNLGYLAHHLDTMREDGYLPEDFPEFPEFQELIGKIMSGTATIEEMTDFICHGLGPLHEALVSLRTETFWEDGPAGSHKGKGNGEKIDGRNATDQ